MRGSALSEKASAGVGTCLIIVVCCKTSETHVCEPLGNMTPDRQPWGPVTRHTRLDSRWVDKDWKGGRIILHTSAPCLCVFTSVFLWKTPRTYSRFNGCLFFFFLLVVDLQGGYREWSPPYRHSPPQCPARSLGPAELWGAKVLNYVANSVSK